MLDIKFIRENKDLIAAAAKKKRIVFDVEALIKADDERRVLIARVEKNRAEQNTITEMIATRERFAPGAREDIIVRVRALKEEGERDETRLKDAMREWQRLMLAVPNIPDISVPEGESDAENQELRRSGEPPEFPFAPKSHLDLMRSLDLADFERGAKVAGFRGYFLKNDGFRLSLALWQLTIDTFSEYGFTLIGAPSLLRREAFLGTGYLPGGEDDLYKTQDESYLAGTAEVPVMGYYMDEVLSREQLPLKILAFSPCYRREAGSHGKDTRGLIRVHEFFKLEQVVLCEARHEESVRLHEELTANAERLLERLGIPYRLVINCGGDLGQGQVKKYDLEAWVPSEKHYRETHSSSYFHDFQTRRLNIRYRDEEGKLRFAHSLNNTALATPRLLVPLIENYQQQDGTIMVPEALEKYMGKKFISKP
ncbi:MAG: serine--tRNA ligase [bacterium]|nr:serine--tRNA ligase [bacterium]MDZ4285137.1 serine--tRNA ligase [Patescibacteria group bacterium]